MDRDHRRVRLGWSLGQLPLREAVGDVWIAVSIQGVKADAVPLNGQTITSKPNWTDERQDGLDARLACCHVI
jgi:hypothetical protein